MATFFRRHSKARGGLFLSSRGLGCKTPASTSVSLEAGVKTYLRFICMSEVRLHLPILLNTHETVLRESTPLVILFTKVRLCYAD